MEKQRYEPKEIEPKWQRIWEEKGLFRAEVDLEKPKFYILDMFPYPSAAGLHVGNVVGYAGTDVVARFKRMKGMNVLHPMGWDSFGLPAEQYAIKTGTHPAVSTEANILSYRKQLKMLGFSYDWSREFATSDPAYYKWTQWIFTKLYERGLAYEAEVYVNYCPALGTVLANEEVEEGRSIEGGYPVERRPLRQWMLRITAYADRLLEDLELVDWPDSVKRMQEHWIGKSEGAQIYFKLEKREETIAVFTTRHDTLFGTTFLVIAPEHPLVEACTQPAQRKDVEEYCELATHRSDLERTGLNREKSGVFTGSYVLHPVTSAKVPLWVADYVLPHYGTGAVMGVPANDDRDFVFAKKYDLAIVPVVDPDVGSASELLEAGLTPQEIRVEVLGANRAWMGSGKIINSHFGDLSLDDLDIEAAKERMVEWLEKKMKGKRITQYKLRDWLFSRQRYWGEPIPILHFADGTQRTLDVDELPLMPPQVTDFRPSGTGESPLAKVEEWVEIVDPKTRKTARRETNTMPQWAGSCWYYLRFLDAENGEAAWDREKEKYWMPVDLYVGGIEHAVLHLLYARFWHKVLFDLGLVSTKEPFGKLRNQGLVLAHAYRLPTGGYVAPQDVKPEMLASQVLEKMSKSKLNGVTPDEVIETYGADSLRLYELFMGPFEREKQWNTDGVTGCRRFLNRVYDFALSDKITDQESEAAMRLVHPLILEIERDIEALSFNTAIAKMMECLNGLYELPSCSKAAVKIFIRVLFPFAPHISDELWNLLGEKGSLTAYPFPKAEARFLETSTTLYVVQVNGKLRGRFELPKNKSQEEIFAFAQEQPLVAKHLKGKVLKVVFVPNALLNIVVQAESDV